MIAEESFSNIEQPNISLPETNLVLLIIESMKQTVPNFKSYIASGHHKKKILNEDELTQVFIEQAQIAIRKQDYPFNISCQYRDIYNFSKGFSDLYFYPNEQDISTTSLYSVECKRLPSPDKAREKEYVIGTTNNGGIERYKIEKHGKGLDDCGLLGFIEKEDTNHWEMTINNWIKELTEKSQNWNNDEILQKEELNINFCFLKSIVHRKTSDIRLFHIWIPLN